MSLPEPDEFENINEQFIEIILANDLDVPMIQDIEVKEYNLETGFVVLPLPLDILELWRELLEGGNGIDDNF